MMYYIYMLSSLAGDCAITIHNRMVQSFRDIWKPIVIFPALFCLCVIFHVIAISVISLFVDKNKPCRKINNFFRRVSIETLDLVMHITHVRLHMAGEEILPKDKCFLLISNHLSVFDPMIAMRVFSDKNLAFVSKKENLQIPFIGRLMTASGCLSLDRENNRSAVKTIKQASEQISGGLVSMGIYPEGGINKTGKVLLPFHSGSFKIAKKACSPIVITTIKNTEKIFRKFLFVPTHVYIDIIRVIQPEEYSSMKTQEIAGMVWNIMYEHLAKDDFYTSEAKSQDNTCLNIQ